MNGGVCRMIPLFLADLFDYTQTVAICRFTGGGREKGRKPRSQRATLQTHGICAAV